MKLRAVDLKDLKDPEKDSDRAKESRMVSNGWCLYSSWLCTFGKQGRI